MKRVLTGANERKVCRSEVGAQPEIRAALSFLMSVCMVQERAICMHIFLHRRGQAASRLTERE
jgi:hypothetical protein